MNNSLTPPPEHDLRSAIRERQRDELIAIVAHEAHQGTPRRRFVPLAAAAAVLVLTAGLAVGVPALRGDDAQPPVSGADSGVAKSPVEPLSDKDKVAFGDECDRSTARPGRRTAPPRSGTPSTPEAKGPYTVVDGFRWVKAPATLLTTQWVTLRYSDWLVACGYDAKGEFTTLHFSPGEKTQRAAVNGGNDGTYTREATRITVAIRNGAATEAVLRNGFYYSPVPYAMSHKPSPNDPPTYIVRAYDADGKQIYATPKTFREQTVESHTCYTDPEGKEVVFYVTKEKPPVSQCRRGVAWNW